ncbi:MAG: hypothetical protein ACI9UU_002225, partial [Candidatus Azotimanducaceae bacterium]
MFWLFDKALDLGRNIAPDLRRSAVPVLRKQALARTPGLFSTPALARVLGIGFLGAMFRP